MKIAIGNDHRGFELKNYIIEKIDLQDWIDVGCFDNARCDYPEFAKLVAQSVLSKDAHLGILICGSGIGMAIAANRFKGIYAGLCWTPDVAISAREDDNINILVLPSDFISNDQAIEIIQAWLRTIFKGGHYQERLDMIDK